MNVYLGADHRAFDRKEQLKEWLIENGHIVHDCGNDHYDPEDDYVDFGVYVGRKLAEALHHSPEPETTVGIALCGSGVGVSIATNRIRGVRCTLSMSVDHVVHARENDHVNCLALASEYTSLEESKDIVHAFLNTQPKKIEKYLRRSRKLDQIA